LVRAGRVCAGGFFEQFACVAIATSLDVRTVTETTMSAMLPAAPAAWLRSMTVSTYQIPWFSACLRGDAARDRPPYLRRLWAAGCVVICSRHRAALVDTCAGCEGRIRPVFRWAGGGPMLVCVAYEAPLHGGATGEPFHAVTFSQPEDTDAGVVKPIS